MKKLTEWVEKSFLNKTVFVIAILLVFLIVFVLIPRGFKLLKKMKLIDSGIVYVVSGGKKYHLYEDCSNMDSPKESTESKQIQVGRTRCSKCYAGVMNHCFSETREGKNEIRIIEAKTVLIDKFSDDLENIDDDFCNAYYIDFARAFHVSRFIQYDAEDNLWSLREWCKETLNECLEVFDERECRNVTVEVSVLYVHSAGYDELLSIEGKSSRNDSLTFGFIMFGFAALFMFAGFIIPKLELEIFEDKAVLIYFVFMGAALVFMIIGGLIVDKYQ